MSRLTPLDIRHVEFSRRAGGYDRREVKAFMERLALEVEDALRESQGLRKRLSATEAEVARLRNAEAELQTAVMATERIAGDLKETAKREAQLLLDDAERQRRARLADVEDGLLRSHARLGALEMQRRLFKEQFKALLQAYATALEADDDVEVEATGGALEAGGAPEAGGPPGAAYAARAGRQARTIDPEDALLDDTVRP